MQSRIEMICEDVNQLCNNNSTMLTTAPTAPEPKLTRTMIICEDVNRNDKDDNNDADNPLADHNLLLQEATPPDDQEGTLNMNQEHQHSLFCAPASPERSPSVLEQKPRVWRQQLGVPQRGFGSGNRADWDSSNRPVRLPRLVRRGVGGLKWRQTCGGTTNSTTTFTGRPKCIFKCDASNPKSSIYPDMPCLMCYEMRGYYGSGGGGGDDEYYGGGGGGSEFDELSTTSSPSSTRMRRHIHQSWVHCCSSKSNKKAKSRKLSKLSSKSKLSSSKLSASTIGECKRCHNINKCLGPCLKWRLLQLSQLLLQQLQQQHMLQ